MVIESAVFFLVILAIIGYVATHADGKQKALRKAQQENAQLRELVGRIYAIAEPQKVVRDDPFADQIVTCIQQYRQQHPREIEGA